MSMQNLIDERAALEALNGDRQLLSELAVMFVEDAPNLLQELEAATERRDFETAARTIHSLRGLSSTFYAANIVDLASRLENDVKNASFDSLYAGGFHELSSSIQCLAQALREAGYVA